MTSDQVYRHSIFDKAYYDQTRKGYEGKAKVGFTDRAGRTIGRGKKYNVAAMKNPAEFIGAYGARLTTDILSDGTRQFYWRYNHPLAIGQKIVEQAVPKLGDVKSPLQRALITGAVGAPTAASTAPVTNAL